MKRSAEQELARGAGHEAAEARRPSDENIERTRIASISTVRRRGQTELDRSREEDREQLHVGGLVWLEPSPGSYQRAVSARRVRRRPIGVAPIACTRHVDPHSIRARATAPRAVRGARPVRRAAALADRHRLGGRPPRRAAARAAGRPARCGRAASSSTTSSRRGRRRSLQDELGAPPSAVVVVFHSDSLLAGTPAFEAAAAEAIAGVPGRAVRRPDRARTRSRRARSRPTATPPTTSSS